MTTFVPAGTEVSKHRTQCTYAGSCPLRDPLEGVRELLRMNGRCFGHPLNRCNPRKCVAGRLCGVLDVLHGLLDLLLNFILI